MRRPESWLLLAAAAWLSAGRSPLPPGGRAAPQAVVDAGTLVISQGGTVVGRETFTLKRGRPGSPEGYTLSATASYPPTRPRVTFWSVVELGPDSQPVQAQYDLLGDGQRRIYVRFGPRRLSLRMVRPGGESAQELPASGRPLAVDDSVFALFALRPPLEVALQALVLGSGTAATGVARSLGIERAAPGGRGRPLEHVVLELDGEPRHLWYDGAGRLVRVELPRLGLVAERLPGES